MKQMGRTFAQYTPGIGPCRTDKRSSRNLEYQHAYLIAAASDLAAIGFGVLIPCIGYDDLLGGSRFEWSTYLGVWLLCSPLFLLGNWAIGLYATPVLVDPVRQLVRALTVSVLMFLALVSALSLLNLEDKISTRDLLSIAGAISISCLLARVAAIGIIIEHVRRNMLVGRSVFLIGEASELEALTPTDLMRQFGLHETGRLAVGPSEARDPRRFQSLIQGALVQARAGRSKELIIVTPFHSVEYLSTIETGLRLSPLPARLIPPKDLRTIIDRQATRSDVARYIVDLQRAPMRPYGRVAKRALDVVGATLGVALLVPLLVAVALAIKVDSPGPAIFRQRRNGFDQRQFVIFKFRTMRVLEDGGSIVQAKRNDDRITKVGRFLRRSSLDELPQLFNVLRGEMSLVGPRPHALAHDQFYTSTIDDYCMRHHVKPGITGWAQINGCRGETSRPDDMERRVRFDLWYIRHWSLPLDLKILFRTCFDVFGHDAY